MRPGILFILVLALFFAGAPTEAKKVKKFEDSCAKASKTLDKAEGSVTRLIAGRAIVGALIGGAIGALVSKDEAKGALRGAVAGAAVGGLSGYLEAKKRAANDRHALTGSVYEDVARSNQEAARALAAFVEVRTCRFETAKTIKDRLARAELSAEEARVMLGEHKIRMAQDIVNAEKFGRDYGNSLTQFRSAADFVAEENATDKAYVAQLAAPPPVPLGRVVTAVGMRADKSPKAPPAGRLTKGERVEVINAPSGGWVKIRKADGQTGYVTQRQVTVPPKPKLIDPTLVSEDVRLLAPSVFEGVEKRKALDREVQVAKAGGDETFDI